jgi:adenosylcobinamide kinase/adenosylcobinamide-phosphate guanylyltransferase
MKLIAPRTCFPFNPRAGIAVGHLKRQPPEGHSNCHPFRGCSRDDTFFSLSVLRRYGALTMSCELILGGARSGKSRYAEQRAHEACASTGHAVTVIATAEAGDEEMEARIRRHRADRPASWRTVEAPLALAEALRRAAAPRCCVIVDCLTLWLSNLLFASAEALDGLPPGADAESLTLFRQERDALLATLPTLPGRVLLVANEVGLGLVPDTPLGRLFRDEAGRLNQAVAALCPRVVFIAAGLPLVLKAG